MNKLSEAKRASILRCLIEGTSIRSTSRITGASKATILKLLVEAGEFCSIYQSHVLRDIPCTRLDADEIWAFVGAKQRNATRPGGGDVWTFTCLDPDSKLMVSWLVGDRSAETATMLLQDVADRVTGRVQLSTDGHGAYEVGVRASIGWKVDWAQVIKRRFTRLTNAFSKKVENQAHAVSLAFMAYNFITPHGTLTKENGGIKTTPAMAVGLANRPWRVEDILARMDPTRPLQSK